MRRPRFDVHLHSRCPTNRLHFRAKAIVDRSAHGSDPLGSRACELVFGHAERSSHALTRASKFVLELNRGIAELGCSREEGLDLRGSLRGAKVASTLSADGAGSCGASTAPSGPSATQRWAPGNEYDEQGHPKHASRPHRTVPPWR
jgi:hypothetical protein